MEQSLTQDGEQTTQVGPDSKNSQPDVPLSPKKKRGTKRKTSKMWDHFTIIEGTYEVPKRSECNYCQTSIGCHSKSNGTSTMLNHLANICSKYPYGKYGNVTKGQQTLAFKTKGDGQNEVVGVTWSVEACIIGLAKMIVMDELPFRFVEGLGFKHFC
ncbi:hypothetical protein GIB67_017040, partial [Kingdonia uniflora]